MGNKPKTNEKKPSHLNRYISGVVMFALLLLVTVPGENILWGALTVISIGAMFELYRVFDIQWKLPGIVGYLSVIVYYLFFLTGQMSGDRVTLIFLFWLAGVVLINLTVMVFTYGKFTFEQIAASMTGVIYIGVLLSPLYLVRRQEYGLWKLYFMLVPACLTDMGAYTVGVLIGKHKFVPKLSPKKTWEGVFGGVFFGTLITVLFCMVINHFVGPVFVIWQCAVIAVVCSMVSMIGDLAASAIKRMKNVKDYGKLIPGHGGILDRIDSILYVVPICYLMMELFAK